MPDSIVTFATRGVLALNDASGVVLTHTSQYELGDFQGGPFPDVLNEVVDLQRRGVYLGSGFGDRIWPSGSFSAYLVLLTETAPGTILQFINGHGPYASGGATPSTSVGGGAVRHLDLKITWQVEGGTDQVLLLKKCRITPDSIAEASDGNKISFSWICKGEVWFNGALFCREIQ
jgi:hypothetical protein